MPTFAVNQFTTMAQSFEEDLEVYKRLGVRGIEVCTQKLAADRDQAADQLKRLAEEGFTVTSVQPKVHSLFADSLAPQPTDPQRRLEQFRSTIDMIVETLPEFRGPVVTIGGAAPQGNLREAWRTAHRAYPELADYAGARQLTLAFEPIHPLLMNQDTFVYTLDQAKRLIERVNRANFGLVFDDWHLWQEPNLTDRLKPIAQKIFIAHHSDWPTNGPRRFADRAIPGQGEIDMPAIFKTLDTVGYRGDHALEILSANDLSDSLWQQDPAQVITQSRQALRQAGCPGA